jgi:arylsulfatase A-like enzyme
MRQNKNKKWFFYTHFLNNCHLPFETTPYFLKMYSGKVNYPSGSFASGRKRQNFIIHLESLTEEERQANDIAYSAEVSCIDAQIGLIMQTLKRYKLLNDTVIIISADHGEALGEDNQFGHSSESMDEHTLHIPFILYAPEIFPGPKRIKEITEAVDIFPTILAISGIKNQEHFDGRSLVGLMNGEGWQKEAAYSEGCMGENNPFSCSLRTSAYRLVWNTDRDKFALYAITDGQENSINIAEDFPERKNELLQKLLSLTGYSDRKELKPAAKPVITKDTLRTMRSLGYLQ